MLRENRKKRKEEERKQREAYDKRMQELKASFLDENSHLSTGEVNADNTTVNATLDETSQGSWTNSQRSRHSLGNFEMNALGPVKQVKANHQSMFIISIIVCFIFFWNAFKVTAETLFEYRWPLEGKNSEHYFLQEQVCEYLDLKSFKRRYPQIYRRKVDTEERDFLVEMRVVNETQADLGLTALLSSTVLDIMSTDYYEKYDAYMQVVMERKDKVMRQSNLQINTNEMNLF